MGRWRGRKASLREAAALPAELLEEVDGAARTRAGAFGSEPLSPPTEIASPASEEEVDSTGAESTESNGPVVPRDAEEDVKRWAKAVGRLKATRRREARRNRAKAAQPPLPLQVEKAASPSEGQRPAGPPRRGSEEEDGSSDPMRPAADPLARARELVEQGRVQEAIQLYLGILTVNPANPKAHNNLGMLYDQLKRFEAALEHLREAERLQPDSVEILVNYASTLTSLARYDEARALLGRAQQLAPDDLRARLGLGVLYFRRGLYGQAEPELRSVCALDGANGPAYYYLGEALNRLGRYDEASEALATAAELMPKDPRPFYTLGHLYDRRHRPEDAAELYRHARRLQSG